MKLGDARPTILVDRIQLRGAQTRISSGYSKLKMRNQLKIPKRNPDVPSHPRMKKLLLVATVLVSGVTLSQAGINLSIGIGLPLPPLPPLPRPAVVIRQPVAICPPPVYVAPPVCPPRVIVTCPPPVCYQPVYEHREHRRGYDRWERRGNGRNHWR